jgi:hypothetical protein
MGGLQSFGYHTSSFALSLHLLSNELSPACTVIPATEEIYSTQWHMQYARHISFTRVASAKCTVIPAAEEIYRNTVAHATAIKMRTTY